MGILACGDSHSICASISSHVTIIRSIAAICTLSLVSVSATGHSTTVASDHHRPSMALDATPSQGSIAWTASITPAVRQIGSLDGVWDLGERGLPAAISPDGQYFFVITRQGNVVTDLNDDQLIVFSADDVMQAIVGAISPPSPMRIIHSHEFDPAAQWVDPTHIQYTSPTKAGDRQAYLLDVATGHVRQLTNVSAPARLGAVYSSAAGAIYSVFDLGTDPATLGQYPVFPVTNQMMREVSYWGIQQPGREHKRDQIGLKSREFAKFGQQAAWRLKSRSAHVQTNLPRLAESPYFSPDGRRAVMLRAPLVLPKEWSKYGQLEISGAKGRWPVPGGEVTQFILIDLKRGHEKPLIDAPSGFVMDPIELSGPPVLWAADGRNLVLCNTALPIEGAGAKPENAAATYIVAVDAITGKWDELERLRDPSGVNVLDWKWIEKGKSFVVHHERDGRPSPGALYTWNGAKWSRTMVEPASAEVSREVVPSLLRHNLKLELRESQNDPPMLYAENSRGEIALLPPDPALTGVWLAPTHEYQWKDGKGLTQTGGLTLPRELPPQGAKLPLVIQVKRYEPDRFRPSGPYRTGFATQELAAAGYAVLSIWSPEEVTGTPEDKSFGRPEIRQFIDWVETAAEALSRTHQIDLQRVGLVGFSRTGYLVQQMLEHERRLHVAAAVIADSAHGTFANAMAFVAGGEPNLSSSYENAYGGPFFQNKQSWLDSELSFNVDRITTPVMFADHVQAVFMIDTFGAFKQARRPFDYVGIPARDHDIQEPKALEASHTLTVDWMNFWLLGKETHRLDDPTRYSRWNRIKGDWEAQQAWEARGYPLTSIPNDPITVNDAGYDALYRQHDTEKAVRFFTDNVELNPRSGSAYDSLGEGYVQAGDREKAITAYEKAVALGYGAATRTLLALRKAASLSILKADLRSAYEKMRAESDGPIN